MTSSILSSMLFLLLVMLSLDMDDALGAQNEIRKLKETVKMGRNLEDNDHRSSKMWIGPSTTKRCGGRIYKGMAATYRPGHGQFHPLPGEYSSSLCIACDSSSSSCYSIRCITTERCTSVNGSPMTCTTSENCERIP